MKKVETEFLIEFEKHVDRSGEKSWGTLRANFPDMPAATFWRRISAAKEFFEMVDEEERQEKQALLEQSSFNNLEVGATASRTSVSSSLIEPCQLADPSDVRGLAAYAVRMAQNLENAAVVAVDGHPQIADRHSYITAARLMLAAGRLVTAADKT
jgi:hypothetical protein